MSVWTHVAGVARVDDLRIGPDMDIQAYFDNIFGLELSYEDLCMHNYSFFGNYMPMGSEGSLTKSIWVNPKVSQIAAYTVSVFGDLRDYDEPEKIINWFKEACSKCAIRNAVITAECERGNTLTWTWSYKEDESNE